jgi:hypothetical protein
LKENQILITTALMANYDRINRPVTNENDPVMVQLQPSLFSILDVVCGFPDRRIYWWLELPEFKSRKFLKYPKRCAVQKFKFGGRKTSDL